MGQGLVKLELDSLKYASESVERFWESAPATFPEALAAILGSDLTGYRITGWSPDTGTIYRPPASDENGCNWLSV
jgi:hypothetical protein